MKSDLRSYFLPSHEPTSASHRLLPKIKHETVDKSTSEKATLQFPPRNLDVSHKQTQAPASTISSAFTPSPPKLGVEKETKSSESTIPSAHSAFVPRKSLQKIKMISEPFSTSIVTYGLDIPSTTPVPRPSGKIELSGPYYGLQDYRLANKVVKSLIEEHLEHNFYFGISTIRTIVCKRQNSNNIFLQRFIIQLLLDLGFSSNSNSYHESLEPVHIVFKVLQKNRVKAAKSSLQFLRELSWGELQRLVYTLQVLQQVENLKCKETQEVETNIVLDPRQRPSTHSSEWAPFTTFLLEAFLTALAAKSTEPSSWQSIFKIQSLQMVFTSYLIETIKATSTFWPTKSLQKLVKAAFSQLCLESLVNECSVLMVDLINQCVHVLTECDKFECLLSGFRKCSLDQVQTILHMLHISPRFLVFFLCRDVLEIPFSLDDPINDFCIKTLELAFQGKLRRIRRKSKLLKFALAKL